MQTRKWQCNHGNGNGMRQCSNADSCIFQIVHQHLNLIPTFVHICTHGCKRGSVLKPNLNSKDILCPWCSTCPDWRDGAQSQIPNSCAVQQICDTFYPPSSQENAILEGFSALLSNPFCLNFNKKPFASQAAYTQHIDRNIGCYNFIVKKSHRRN